MTVSEIIGTILMSVMAVTMTGYMLYGLYSVISGFIAERRSKKLVDRETYVKAMRAMKLAGWEALYGTRNPLEAQISELKHKIEEMNSILPFKQRVENIVVMGVTQDPDTELPVYEFSYNVVCESNDLVDGFEHMAKTLRNMSEILKPVQEQYEAQRKEDAIDEGDEKNGH